MRLINRTPKPYTCSDRPRWVDGNQLLAFIPNYDNHMINVDTKEVYVHVGSNDTPLNFNPVPIENIGGVACITIGRMFYGNPEPINVTILTLFALAFAGKITNMCYPRALDGDIDNLELGNIEWCDYTFIDDTQTLKLFEFSSVGPEGHHQLFMKDGMYTQCSAWHLSRISGMEEEKVTQALYTILWDLGLDRSSWDGHAIETVTNNPNMMLGMHNCIMYDYLAITYFIELCMNVDRDEVSNWRDNLEQGYNIPLIVKGVQ